MSNIPMCCYLEGGHSNGARCERSAQWTIVFGETPDDYTEACSAHVGELLTDAPEHRIYPLSQMDAQEATT